MAAPVALAAALLWLAAPAAAGSSVHAETALERAVDSLIAELRRRGEVRPDERTAWVVYDFTEDRKLVSINEDAPLAAASLIKPFVALAFLHEVEAGRLPYSAQERRRLEAMIQRSDNAAANWALRRLGGPAAVERLLKREYGGLLRQLKLVEYIPAGGRTYRNMASAHDYSRFLYALWTDGLPRSEELRRLMHLPNRDRLYEGARRVPPGTKVYDKTGSTSRLCGDVGILAVMGPGGRAYPYIVVGLIEKGRSARRYGEWIRSRGDVIRRVSDLAYETMAARHGFGRAR